MPDARRREDGLLPSRGERTGSVDKWKSVFELAPDGYFITDLEGTILVANRRCEELAGRGRNELIGMSCLEETLVSATDAPKARAILERGARGQSAGPEEFRIVTKSGDSIFLEITTHPVTIEHAKLLLCIARDTTQHHRYEDSLKKANARLQALIHAIPDMVFFKDLEGRYLMVNRAVEAVAGLPGERFIGMTPDDHLPPDAAGRCRESDLLALQGDQPIHTEEYAADKDGWTRYFDIIKSPIRDGGGELLGLVAVCRDITERKKTEDALRQNEKFIRGILESVDQGFIVIDRDHRIMLANKAYLDQAKLTLPDVIGRKCFSVSHGSTKACYERGEHCAVRQTFETGEPRTATHIHRNRDQDLVYVDLKSYPLKDEEGRTIAAIEIVNNITDKKRLEEQLRHSQKMEAIGQLAGGIAHDFNNILTTIIGYGSLLKKGLNEDDPLRHDAAQVLEAAERASNLTRGLLAFGRKQSICPCAVNVNEVIGNMGRLLRRIIGEDVDILFHTEDEALVVMADVGHFEQVLMNLATNAKDAMSDGGCLTISTGKRHLDREFIQSRGFGKEGDYARITVTDTGVGFDDRIKARIFEPFFTTKATGKGTGLGLSIVYGIVKQHNGYITCESEPGSGTRFDIYFPLIKDEAVPIRPKGEAEPGGGNETILLVEDEEAVRALMKKVLERGGYRVIEAKDGEEAIERYCEHRASIQLLLLDVIMPKKNGRDVHAWIQRERPDIKAIFVSGYTADIVTTGGILERGAAFLSKPVSPPALLGKVRELLDGNGSAK